MKPFFALFAVLALAGCEIVPDFLRPAERQPDAAQPAPESAALPDDMDALLAAPPPAPEARTAAEFDTTTDEQKDAARAAPESGETRLGTTVASLGDPAEPGLWLRTPLVQEERQGRVETEDGASARVRLIPRGGPETAGSQLSLAAFQTLGLALTVLPTLTVYAD